MIIIPPLHSYALYEFQTNIKIENKSRTVKVFVFDDNSGKLIILIEDEEKGDSRLV